MWGCGYLNFINSSLIRYTQTECFSVTYDSLGYCVDSSNAVLVAGLSFPLPSDYTESAARREKAMAAFSCSWLLRPSVV